MLPKSGVLCHFQANALHLTAKNMRKGAKMNGIDEKSRPRRTTPTGQSRVAYLSVASSVKDIDDKRRRGAIMNPHNPTTTDMQQTEQLFFRQMQQITKSVTGPKGLYSARLSSFDFQCSDRWM